MIGKIKILYEYFYQQSIGNRFWEFTPSKKDLLLIEKFISWLTISHGDEWLFDYFCYQFSRYINLKTRFGKGIVMLNWVIGQKAFKKYQLISEEEIYWRDKFKIDKKLKNPLLSDKKQLGNKNYKERERKRFYNDYKGFVHCSELELFDIKSLSCKLCKFKSICNG